MQIKKIALAVAFAAAAAASGSAAKGKKGDAARDTYQAYVGLAYVF